MCKVCIFGCRDHFLGLFSSILTVFTQNRMIILGVREKSHPRRADFILFCSVGCSISDHNFGFLINAAPILLCLEKAVTSH